MPPPKRPSQPGEIAREAIRLLATQRKLPTPENFRLAYEEVSGVDSTSADKAASSPPAAEPEKPMPRWPETLRPLFKQWDAHQIGLGQARKREMMERIFINFGHDARQLQEKLDALAHTWSAGVASDTASTHEAETPPPDAAEAVSGGAAGGRAPQASGLIDAPVTATVSVDCHPFIATLSHHMAQLADCCEPRWPDLSCRASDFCKSISGSAQLQPEQVESWSQLWRDVLMRAEDDHELAAGLKRLVGLLFLNIGELVGDEVWLSGQLAAMQNLMEGNLQPDTLLEAERSLRELAYKQGVIKGSLDEAKAKLKTLITVFIDRIGEMSQSTDGYHARIGAYSEKISQASDIAELGDVVEGLSADVAGLRDALHRSHSELVEARGHAEQAEARMHELEKELAQVSNLVREDQLTGALNRRGMDEALSREVARAERLQAQLSIGLLDIDHFKKINDALGHQVGDQALRHLAKVVRTMLRPTDTLARYGGEEFLILLPNSSAEEAAEVLKRVQRALTKEFFLHENERVLITFSGGVAQRQEMENEAAMIARADAAMYRAKHSGRNRVEIG